MAMGLYPWVCSYCGYRKTIIIAWRHTKSGWYRYRITHNESGYPTVEDMLTKGGKDYTDHGSQHGEHHCPSCVNILEEKPNHNDKILYKNIVHNNNEII